MTHMDKQYESSAKIAGISWALFFILIIVWLVILAGCSQISEPVERFDISGRYQENDWAMVLVIYHLPNNQIDATLTWNGFTMRLSGGYEPYIKQINLTGNDCGYIGFDLLYGEKLTGWVNYNGAQYHSLEFVLIAKMNLHNQGLLQ